jgi:hypothetical protein
LVNYQKILQLTENRCSENWYKTFPTLSYAILCCERRTDGNLVCSSVFLQERAKKLFSLNPTLIHLSQKSFIKQTFFSLSHFFLAAAFHTRLVSIEWSHKMRKRWNALENVHSMEYNSNYELKLDRLQLHFTVCSLVLRGMRRKQHNTKRETECNFYSLMIFDLCTNARLTFERLLQRKWKCEWKEFTVWVR